MLKEATDILNRLNHKQVKDEANRLGLNNILVFGSVLTEEFNEGSDVDIAILANSKVPFREVLRLEMLFEDLLGREIDVIDLNSENLDIFIKIDILNTGKSIYTSDNNENLEEIIDKTEIYYRENEHFFMCRRRDLIG